jgi:predicted DNA-binding transcriptional regulator AlpA
MIKSNSPQNEITFDNMPQAVAKVYEEVSLIKSGIEELRKNYEPKIPTELLTVQEVAKLLKVDRSTLWNWQQKQTLVPYGIGARVYYRRSDIENALILLGTKKGAKNEK